MAGDTMPNNVITINNQIRYDISDDKMKKLIKYLDAVGQKVSFIKEGK